MRIFYKKGAEKRISTSRFETCLAKFDFPAIRMLAKFATASPKRETC